MSTTLSIFLALFTLTLGLKQEIVPFCKNGRRFYKVNVKEGTEYIIQSPSYPLEYQKKWSARFFSSRADEQFEISSQEGITVGSRTASNKCLTDYLAIRGLNEENTRKTTKLCGEQDSFLFQSYATTTKIMFKSGNSKAVKTAFEFKGREVMPAPTTETMTTTTSSSSTTTTTIIITTTTTTTRATNLNSDCKCGRDIAGDRIVGGSETEPHEHPWQVALVETGYISPFCGGTIVSESYILTAAHCVTYNDTNTGEQRTNQPEDIVVVIGEHDWYDTYETDHTERKIVEKVIVHKDYDRETEDNDFALIKLQEPINFSAFPDNQVGPACLPKDDSNQYVNEDVFASGWGTLYYDGDSPDQLHDVEVTTISNLECNEYMSWHTGGITDNMLCAHKEDGTGGLDTCQGDSGGPLVLADGTLIGVVSFGYSCAVAGEPGVYARVSKILNQEDFFGDVVGCSK